MDIVYLVKNSPDNNSEELRYSLRSLKNIPHNSVIIAGEKPDWVTNVTYLPVEQNLTKGENVANNLRAAVESGLVSDTFILMNDDFFFMKPQSEMPVLNFGPMKDVIAEYRLRYPEGSAYIATMVSLYDTLIARGFTQPLSYELHMPMVINKQNVKKMYEEVTGRLYQFRSYYGNYFNIGGQTVPDVKIFRDNQHNPLAYIENPIEYLESQAFLSVTGGSFKYDTPGDFVRSKFVEKSVYEL